MSVAGIRYHKGNQHFRFNCLTRLINNYIRKIIFSETHGRQSVINGRLYCEPKDLSDILITKYFLHVIEQLQFYMKYNSFYLCKNVSFLFYKHISNAIHKIIK